MIKVRYSSQLPIAISLLKTVWQDYLHRPQGLKWEPTAERGIYFTEDFTEGTYEQAWKDVPLSISGLCHILTMDERCLSGNDTPDVSAADNFLARGEHRLFGDDTLNFRDFNISTKPEHRHRVYLVSVIMLTGKIAWDCTRPEPFEDAPNLIDHTANWIKGMWCSNGRDDNLWYHGIAQCALETVEIYRDKDFSSIEIFDSMCEEIHEKMRERGLWGTEPHTNRKHWDIPYEEIKSKPEYLHMKENYALFALTALCAYFENKNKIVE